MNLRRNGLRSANPRNGAGTRFTQEDSWKSRGSTDFPQESFVVKCMVDVRELLNYNEEVRHRYLDALAKLPWDELIKNREASFHSLRNIFIHTLGATDHWLDLLLKERTSAKARIR